MGLRQGLVSNLELNHSRSLPGPSAGADLSHCHEIGPILFTQNQPNSTGCPSALCPGQAVIGPPSDDPEILQDLGSLLNSYRIVYASKEFVSGV